MRYKVFSEGFGVIRDELLLGVNDEFAEIAEMVLPWWTSQSDGTHSQPSRGCGLRARDRSQLFGYPRGGGPAIRSDHPFSARHGCRCGWALSRIHARRGSELGTQCEGSGGQRHPTSWSSRGGAPARSCGRSPCARAEGVLAASARCQGASADWQGCAACRVRAGVAPVSRIPGRIEEHLRTPNKTLFMQRLSYIHPAAEKGCSR